MCLKIPDFCAPSYLERYTPRLIGRLHRVWQEEGNTDELACIRDVMLDTHTQFKSVVEEIDFLYHLSVTKMGG